ncbi:MAG: hypothetical protein E6R08_00830 [Nevskiaceae bacterium]|nr:MAG: hypothetical protein E6R08_00830 [Nevskiaceae bacterium]
MIFASSVPTEDGRYRWRRGKGERIHTVTLRTRRGVTSMSCSTMNVDALKAEGEWSAISGDSSTKDAEAELQAV